MTGIYSVTACEISRGISINTGPGRDSTAEVVKLAQMKNATVVATMMGLSGYPADEPRFLGMLGTYGNEGANMAIQDCDCLLALGMRFDDPS